MMNALLITFVSGNLDKYRPESSKELTSFYSLNVAGFTPNKGQIATEEGKESKEVIFYTRNKNLIAYITEKGISYVIYDEDSFSRVDYELIGVKIQRNKVEYYDELAGYENYYLAHYPEGILFVKSYKKVVIKDIYENIDWVFRYDEFGNLHHEFIVKKGGEVADIRIRIKNAEIEVKDKEIEMKTPIGSIIDGRLVAYENSKEVGISYKFEEDLIGFVLNKNSIDGNLVIDPQLTWATYYGGSKSDIAHSISIDNNNNIYIVGRTRSIDFPVHNLGKNAYFQKKKAGGRDVFILKFSDKGIRLWATYYGGKSDDYPTSTSIDKNNNLYVVGNTWSDDFPVYNPGGAYFQKDLKKLFKYFKVKDSQENESTDEYEENYEDYFTFQREFDNNDAFILKFNSSGERLWATYYGGEDDDYANSISIDNNNDIYVVGYTASDSFPVYNPEGGAYFQEINARGRNDAFIIKFNSKGERVWATYYGGNNEDYAHYVSVDNNNNVYVVGYTSSNNFPVYNPGGGAYFQESNAGGDIFILKFNSKGERLWATYYGGNSYDEATSVSIDNDNNVYIVGYTTSDTFPLHNLGGNAYFQEKKVDEYNEIHEIKPSYYDAFILKFNSKGERLWSTYYGGSLNDAATSISVDKDNNIYIIGYTESDDFPIYNPGGSIFFHKRRADADIGFRSPYAVYLIPEVCDVFILKFNSKAERLWATYYGGKYLDYPTSISIDKNNNVYITGYTKSKNLPLHNPQGNSYFQANISGSRDIFIIKFNINNVGK